MAFPGLEVSQCQAPTGGLPLATSELHVMRELPGRFSVGQRREVLAANELALYSNLHIALQQLQLLLEGGHKLSAACKVLHESLDDLILQDSFGRILDHMSGSVPSSFRVALARAWPARGDYGRHPAWWKQYLPARRDYPVPRQLMVALERVDPFADGVRTALSKYYAQVLAGGDDDRRRRLASAKRALALSTELVRNSRPEVRQRVDQIRAAAERLLKRAAEYPNPDTFDLVVRIAADYLPHTLHSYLEVPADFVPAGHQRTATEIVCQQLDIIVNVLDGISHDMATVEANALLANGHFLDFRFATSSLNLPGGSLPTSAPRADS